MKPGNMTRARVLVTGAGGFIGSHLCEFLLARTARVRAFVHYNSMNRWGMLEDVAPRRLKDIEVVAGDLRDAQSVRRAAGGCDVIFHLGALIGIPYSYASPSDVVATNVLGTLNVLQACLDAGTGRLIQTSSSEVYGTAQSAPMEEGHPLHPQSPYAASKVAADKLAESFHHTYGLPVVILRPFNTYGPRQSQRAVIPTIIRQALESSTIRLGRLETRRDLVYVADTVRGFAAAATADGCEGRTIHLGSEASVSVSELVSAVSSIVGKRLRIVPDRARFRPRTSEVERLIASRRLAEEVLGWRPKVTLEKGLEKTILWFRANPAPNKWSQYHI